MAKLRKDGKPKRTNLEKRFCGPPEHAVKRNQFETFLRVFEATGAVGKAAQMAGVTSRAIEKWRKEFPAWEEEFQESKQHFIETLEKAAYERAVNGTTNPGKFGEIRTYSDHLLTLLLRRWNPEYRDSPAQVNVANQNNITQTNNNVRILEDPDWYGNDAHDLATQAPPAHIAGSPLSSEIQTAGLRETVEQDGHGNAGGTAGTRKP